VKDILIPIGLLIFIGLFAYALIRTARKQKKQKSGVFREFARRHGLRFQEEDDGRAQRFAKDFDGIGQFRSPSLGTVVPKDVASGTVNGSEAVLFRHMIRFSEGWSREWFVSGIVAEGDAAERCAVQFCRGSSDKQTMYLRDPAVKEQRVGPYTVVVRAPTPSDAGKWRDPDVLQQWAALAERLDFRPEIQVRGARIAAYPADRNVSIDHIEMLENLFEFSRRSAAL
jgi:hypothetical protein